MKGRAVVVALGAALLLGLSALIAMMGLQPNDGTSYLPAGVEPADLPEASSEGAALLARYCRSCHGVPHPALHTPDDWPRVVDEMTGRIMSRVMAPLPMPSSRERDAIVAYLQRHASGAPPREAAAPAAPDGG
ncbi:MAG TPA: cytochrome c [Vulgatibacter sp.]|nr:cytochrome c [Vulgatibacter sp.]